MKLQTLTNFRGTIKFILILSILIILFCFGITGFVFFNAQNEIREAKNEIYILDDRGNIFYGQLKQMNRYYRLYEYEDHARDFYNLFYSFDQNTYNKNIERALWLVGDCGKDLKRLNDEQKVYENLVSKNLIVTVQILKLNIDISQKPFKGIITGIQTIYRAGGKVSRQLDCTFTITDAQGRSQKNTHGAIINDWKIINSEKIIKKEN